MKIFDDIQSNIFDAAINIPLEGFYNFRGIWAKLCCSILEEFLKVR